MASLCLLGEDGAVVYRWEIGTRPVSIGREADEDVKISDESLSRRHFVVSRDGGNCFLEDLNSQNGTWVDGRRASARATKLNHHDCILAGRSLFIFSENHPPTAPA
jgi:pSer/pThr/pTyr-binding forkhead associated (FHA) protein